jgi:hypothetical protein
MLTRSDLLAAHRQRLDEVDVAEKHLEFPSLARRKPA